MSFRDFRNRAFYDPEIERFEHRRSVISEQGCLLRRMLGVALTAVMLLPLALTVPAAGQAPKQEPQARGLTVFPPNIQLDGTPGQRIERTIAIENSSQVTQKVTTSIRNFKPQQEEGQAAPTDEDSSYSMARWMSVSPSVLTLAPNERRDVVTVISIPQNAEPGSHFGSVIFTPSLPTGSSGPFQTLTEVASLVLLRLPGATNESASVASFGAKVIGDDRGPVDFISRLSNSGTVHFNPAGNITVTDLFGRKVATLPVNTASHPVLPGAIRRFDTRWDTGTLIGRYNAKLHLTYASNTPGQPDKTLDASTTFYVIPPVALAVTGGVLGLLFLLIFRRLRRRKKRKAESA